MTKSQMSSGRTDYNCVQFKAQHTTHARIGASSDGVEQESYYDRGNNWAETLEDLFLLQNPSKGEYHTRFLRFCSLVEK